MFIGLVLCLMLAVPLANIFIYHYVIWGSAWLAFMCTLFFLPLLVGIGKRLGRRVIILDKRQDQVVVNGQPVCALSDVGAVRIGTYIIPTAKDEAFRIHGLYLETVKGEAVEIERAANSGSNIEEVGLVIADFAQVKSSFA